MSLAGGVLSDNSADRAQAAPAAPELPFAASPASLRAWLDTAPPMARAIYAKSVDELREEPGVKLVRQWAIEGRVHLFRERDPDDAGRWRFLIVKAAIVTGEVRIARPFPRGRATPQRSASDIEEGLLTRCEMLLRRAADRAEPCPSNAELARALGLSGDEKGRARAKYLVRCLAEAGRIAVECRGRNLPRVVTIVARGRACGMSTAKGPKNAGETRR